MSLSDTLFSCEETPVWTPATLNPATLPPCLSCTLRLVCTLPGPGSVSPSMLGLAVDENPTTELVISGARYNLQSAQLVFGGIHRLYGQQTVSSGEFLVTFRHVSDTSKLVFLCIPIQQGAASAEYFKTLGSVSRGRPLLSTLIQPSTKILSYPGASLIGRTAQNPKPRTFCAPISTPGVYYVVLTPATISANDMARLIALCDKTIWVGPPKPFADITASRATRLLTLIDKLTIEDKDVRIQDDKGISTKALKCYRLDAERDIRDDKVYIGGAKKEDTLAKELARAAELKEQMPEDDGSVKPGDIETIIGIVLGATVGIILCATVAYYLWKNTFHQYLNVQKLYSSPLSAAKLSAKLPALQNPFRCKE